MFVNRIVRASSRRAFSSVASVNSRSSSRWFMAAALPVATVAATMVYSRADTEESKPEGNKLSLLDAPSVYGRKDVTSSEKPKFEGAFNPETGEINWDCPCLGGMAHGPCGPEFKEAFACFVYSSAEPKGADCIGKFGAMQDCFRKHPDVYAEELRDEDPLDSAKEDKVPAEESVSKAVDESNATQAAKAEEHIEESKEVAPTKEAESTDSN